MSPVLAVLVIDGGMKVIECGEACQQQDFTSLMCQLLTSTEKMMSNSLYDKPFALGMGRREDSVPV